MNEIPVLVELLCVMNTVYSIHNKPRFGASDFFRDLAPISNFGFLVEFRPGRVLTVEFEDEIWQDHLVKTVLIDDQNCWRRQFNDDPLPS